MEAATAYALVKDGKITKFVVTNGGSGYTSSPTITVPSIPGAAGKAKLSLAVMENGPAPVRLFIVDAKDDQAKAFYERFNMIPSPHNLMRLFLSYKTLAAIINDTSV